MKRVAILGEIGSGNLGDDLGYLLLRDALIRNFGELDVLVDIRPFTPNMLPFLEGYHWDAVLLGCGTLLDFADGPYMQMLGTMAARCPVAIVGSGFADPRHVEPTLAGREKFDFLSRASKYVWTRVSPEGCDPTTADPDPVWLYGWHGGGARNGVGLNLGNATFSSFAFDPDLYLVFEKLRDIYPTALVGAWHADVPWLERLKKGGETVYVVTGTKASTHVLGSLRALVATRVHLAVLAACHGVFPILPDYTTKARDVFARSNVPHVVVSIAETAEAFAAAVQDADQNVFKKAVATAQAAAAARVRAAVQALAGVW